MRLTSQSKVDIVLISVDFLSKTLYLLLQRSTSTYVCR